MFVIRVPKLPEYELHTKIFMWPRATSSQPPYPTPVTHSMLTLSSLEFLHPHDTVPPMYQAHCLHQSLVANVGLAEAVAVRYRI